MTTSITSTACLTDEIMEEKLEGETEIGGDGPYFLTAIDYTRNIFGGTSLYDIGTNKCSCTLEERNVSTLIARMIGDMLPKTVNLYAVSTKTKGQYIRKYLKSVGRNLIVPHSVAEPVKSNIDILCSLAALNEVQKSVLTFFATLADNYGLREVTEMFGYLRVHQVASIVSIAVNLPQKCVLEALSGNSRLVTCGIVHVDDTSEYLYSKVRVSGDIKNILFSGKLTVQKLLSHYFEKLDKTSLTWSDFAHIDSSVSFVKSILSKAIEKKQSGVNILFYGESGTGKTELAKLLAQELKVDAYVASTDLTSGDQSNKECNPSAEDRISALHAGQWLLKNGSSLLLFDELEDLFSWGSFNMGMLGRADAKLSKQGFNSILEKNPMPTIWTSNNISGCDPSFIRRFTYAIEFKHLEAKHRARIIRRYLLEGEVSEEEVIRLAEKFDVSPAQISNAVSVAKLTSEDSKPRVEDIECVLKSIEESLAKTGRGSRHPVVNKIDFDTSSYCLEALNTNENLKQMADKIKEWNQTDKQGLSIVLYGPTGTGKSEFVKFLANEVKKDVLVKRGSDIISMWVGGTEANIAAAFREAEEKKSILLFDEVDTFLIDRSRARNSWEITSVNEFLQQLECFKGICACTTNLLEDIIDKAALRRFIFKIGFKYPTIDQCISLFKLMMKDLHNKDCFSEEDTIQIKDGLSPLYGLSPGDYQSVRRRETALGRKSDIKTLIALLKEEVDVKGLEGAKTIGFK